MQNHGSISFIPAGGVTSPLGFRAAAGRAGLKTEGDDTLVIFSEIPAASAAVFTRNLVKAAPVIVSAAHSASHRNRAIVANAGNANCCTGEQGLADARRTCALVAGQLGCAEDEVLVCSTGVIGHQLPMDLLAPAVTELARQCAGGELRGDKTNEACARAFMTTDTRPKFFAASAEIDGKTVTVGGQAKGAGMIAPDMAALHATMLCFLTTDAAVDGELLQEILEASVARSLNSVTVDSDTSTNDTAFLLANGASEAVIGEANQAAFVALVEAVCIALAREIARDGEGATRLVTIDVEGAENESAARQIGMTVANSPLVKTAIFGRDPNWGRIAAAAGRAGVDFDAARLSIWLGDVAVFQNGEPVGFDLAAATAVLAEDELGIRIVVGDGPASWRVWTCDYSYDYIRINADYHT